MAGDTATPPFHGGGLGPAPAEPFAADPIDVVRVGFVGVGLQGGSHVRNFLRIEGVEIVAICDIVESRAEEVAGWVEADGRPRPTLYTRGETGLRAPL